MIKPLTLTTLTAALALSLGGCMVGPDYKRPPVTTAPQFKELPGWAQAQPAAAAPKGAWWTVFNDPLINELEPQVAVSNQTVKQDYYNYQEALAAVKVARASLFPTIGITGSGTRERSGSSSSTSVSHGVINSGSLEGNVSWSPDIWGEVRREVEESKATAQADKATLANATLSEQTELATAIIELRVSDAEIDLLQKTVDAYTEYLRVVQNQGTAGTAAPSDVITARTQLGSAKSSLIELGVARAQYEHAIAVLVGKTPEELSLAHNGNLPLLPTVPVGVPSDLLQRRPDIAEAERKMAAENAAVGVAVAAYYPNISITGADGFSQAPLNGLLHLANHIWSLGADVDETVFDFGARHGEVLEAKANYNAAVASYRGTVLTAFQNVEDDLSNLRILSQQSDVLQQQVKDATDGARIAFNEYQAGTEDYTTAATAQATQLSAQQSYLNVQEERLTDTVSLIGDLGGGWSADELAKDDQAQ